MLPDPSHGLDLIWLSLQCAVISIPWQWYLLDIWCDKLGCVTKWIMWDVIDIRCACECKTTDVRRRSQLVSSSIVFFCIIRNTKADKSRDRRTQVFLNFFSLFLYFCNFYYHCACCCFLNYHLETLKIIWGVMQIPCYVVNMLFTFSVPTT